MTDPTTLREALIVEALGEAATLIRQVEALAPRLDTSCRALLQADARLRDDLADFESRMSAITENAKTQTVKHLAAHTQEAARRSVDQQSRAMADAARVAFAAELGSTLQRLQSAVHPLIAQLEHRWEGWLTHTAVATAAATATWLLPLYLGGG